MKVSYLLSLIILLVFSSCTKEMDVSMIIEDDIVIIAPVFVETSLFMKISGFSNEDLDAICIINDVEYKPDANGFLYIPSILMNEEGQVVKVEAVGFMPALFGVIPSLGDITYLKGRVVRSGDIKTFDAAEGGNILIGLSEYIIPPLSIIELNGEEYFGKVDVKNYMRQSALFASLIETFGYNIFNSSDNKSYSLQTWGGHDIFLFDQEGNELQVKDGIKIQAKISVNSIDDNVIPGLFEVMRFNELEGNWEIDSEASFADGVHLTEISSFGHLRWSKKVETRRAKVKTPILLGALTDILLMVYVDESNPISIAKTNDKGFSFIDIPKEGLFRINSLIPCEPYSASYEYNIVDEGSEEVIELNYNVGFDQAIKVEGSIVNCSGNPVPNGILEVNNSLQTQHFLADNEGNISINLPTCEVGQKSSRVYNPSTQEYSETFYIEIASGFTSFGEIKACQ